MGVYDITKNRKKALGDHRPQVISLHFVCPPQSLVYIGISNTKLHNIVGCFMIKSPHFWKIEV